MIFSRSHTMHPQSPLLTIGGTVLKDSEDLVILWVKFDSKMTFEKHLRSVSIAASQRLGILRKSWRVFHDRSLLGRCFRGFVLTVLEYCSAVWCSVSNWLVCLSVTLLIVDPWQYFVCFIRSGVKRCTLLMVLYLDRMYQCGLHAVLWSHIGTLMHRLASEPCSTARLLFPSWCPCWMILLTPCSMVWDWRVSRAGPMLFYWPGFQLYTNSIPSIIFYSFSLLFILSIGWYCGAGVFGQIGCISLSLSLALPTFFNNNNNISLL